MAMMFIIPSSVTFDPFPPSPGGMWSGSQYKPWLCFRGLSSLLIRHGNQSLALLRELWFPQQCCVRGH